MSKPGRAPTPTPILALRGSKRAKYERPNNEPNPKQGCPRCPVGLSEEAQAEWRRVAPELDRLGILTVIDRGLLAGYCQSWGDFVEARGLVAKTGLTIPRPGGGVMKNPAFTVMNDSRLAMLRFAQEFGLSPSARTRINVEPKEKKLDTGADRFFDTA